MSEPQTPLLYAPVQIDVTLTNPERIPPGSNPPYWVWEDSDTGVVRFQAVAERGFSASFRGHAVRAGIGRPELYLGIGGQGRHRVPAAPTVVVPSPERRVALTDDSGGAVDAQQLRAGDRVAVRQRFLGIADRRELPVDPPTVAIDNDTVPVDWSAVPALIRPRRPPSPEGPFAVVDTRWEGDGFDHTAVVEVRTAGTGSASVGSVPGDAETRQTVLPLAAVSDAERFRRRCDVAWKHHQIMVDTALLYFRACYDNYRRAYDAANAALAAEGKRDYPTTLLINVLAVAVGVGVATAIVMPTKDAGGMALKALVARAEATGRAHRAARAARVARGLPQGHPARGAAAAARRDARTAGASARQAEREARQAVLEGLAGEEAKNVASGSAAAGTGGMAGVGMSKLILDLIARKNRAVTDFKHAATSKTLMDRGFETSAYLGKEGWATGGGGVSMTVRPLEWLESVERLAVEERRDVRIGIVAVQEAAARLADVLPQSSFDVDPVVLVAAISVVGGVPVDRLTIPTAADYERVMWLEWVRANGMPAYNAGSDLTGYDSWVYPEVDDEEETDVVEREEASSFARFLRSWGWLGPPNDAILERLRALGLWRPDRSGGEHSGSHSADLHRVLVERGRAAAGTP